MEPSGPAGRRISVRALAVTACLVLTAGCGMVAGPGMGGVDPRGQSPAPSLVSPEPVAGRWVRLPDSPLSARENPVVVRVGDEVVVVGGYAGPPCPPYADCGRNRSDLRRDGAAYDLATGTWRQIAPAPRALPEMASTAVVDERLYVLAGESVLVWHGAADSWTELPLPGPAGWPRLVADGPRLLVVSGTDEYGVRPDRVWDTRTGTWTTLPADPLRPSFDRVVTATPDGLVLTAKEIAPDGGPADPAPVRAALLPPGEHEWRTLPVSDQLGGWRWSWTGRRLVDPTLGGADGGETNNYGRVIPYGGRLEPATGTWSLLPNAPEQGTGGWPVEAPGGPLVAAEGWVYDDARSTWTRLPRPVDAPTTPGPAVWVGDVLVVHGGAEWNGLDDPENWVPERVWSSGVWGYRAP